MGDGQGGGRDEARRVGARRLTAQGQAGGARGHQQPGEVLEWVKAGEMGAWDGWRAARGRRAGTGGHQPTHGPFPPLPPAHSARPSARQKPGQKASVKTATVIHPSAVAKA